MFSYESFKNRMKRNSEEKIKNVIYTSWYGNTILIIFSLILVVEILSYTIARINPFLYIVLYLLLFSLTIIYICTRKAGLAITENRIVCVIFNHLSFKEKEVHEILKDKIKSISVHKFLYIRFVNLSFINSTGKLEHKKLYFSSFMFGSNNKEFKESSNAIYDELKLLQKKIDRGDF